MINLSEVFEKHSKEYLKDENITQKLHKRLDVCAFLILDNLVPAEGDMITATEHDQIFLDVDLEQLAEVATEEDIANLIRCGVRLCSEYDSLCMFV